MRILLIGIGRWGKNHLKALSKIADELYVADLDPALLKTCEEFSIPANHTTTDYRDFLDRADGIDVVTPANNHLNIARDCFEKRKDLFVEKPIALTSEEAKEMIRMAEEKEVILQVGHIYRYHPATAKIKKVIEEEGWETFNMPTAILWDSRDPGPMWE